MTDKEINKLYSKCPYNGHLADIWVEGYLKKVSEIEIENGGTEIEPPHKVKQRAVKPQPFVNIFDDQPVALDDLIFDDGIAEQVKAESIHVNVNEDFIKRINEFQEKMLKNHENEERVHPKPEVGEVLPW